MIERTFQDERRRVFMVCNFHTMKITILLKDTHVGILNFHSLKQKAHDVCVMAIVTIILHYYITQIRILVGHTHEGNKLRLQSCLFACRIRSDGLN